ncbi:MAG TPA: zf-HC2 domain-containing protein [Candidatus Galloscillospira stercoripullorum]|nr:zf-HC2 domain-containing protein [Candidatus Galloscillospira stercoripullorum]
MDRCEHYTELISASLDGALTAAQQTELEAHLVQCAPCRALLADLKELQDVLEESLPPQEPPEALSQGVMERIRADSAPIPFPVKKRGVSRQWRSLGALAAVFTLVLAGAVGLRMQDLAQPDVALQPASQYVTSGQTADHESISEAEVGPSLQAVPFNAETSRSNGKSVLPEENAQEDPCPPAVGTVYYDRLPQGWEELFPGVASVDALLVSGEEAEAFLTLLAEQEIAYTVEGELSGDGEIQLLAGLPE